MIPLTVIVINWNRPQETLRCLRSLNEEKYEGLEVILVENGSNEDTLKTLEKGNPPVKIIISPVNLGYGGGINLGAQATGNPDDGHFLFLNNDNVIPPGFLQKLTGAVKSLGNGALVSPKIYFLERPEHFYYAGGFFDATNGHFWHRSFNGPDEGQYDKVEEVGYASGCAMMVSKKIFFELGGFEEKYFLYFEDVDLSLRAKKAGYPSYYWPNAYLHHQASLTTGGMWSDHGSYYRKRNILYLMKKHNSARRFLSFFFRHYLPSLFRETKEACGNPADIKKTRIKSLLLGTFHGLTGSMGPKNDQW